MFPTHLLSNLLIHDEAGQYGQREHHHGQTVVSQEVDQSSVEGLHVVLQEDTNITHQTLRAVCMDEVLLADHLTVQMLCDCTCI